MLVLLNIKSRLDGIEWNFTNNVSLGSAEKITLDFGFRF